LLSVIVELICSREKEASLDAVLKEIADLKPCAKNPGDPATIMENNAHERDPRSCGNCYQEKREKSCILAFS
jgi:hypothetical protein